MCIFFSQVRKQFGNTISSFQHTQFELAEMASELLASRMLVRNAAVALDSKHPDTVALCAAAKMFATKHCQAVSYRLRLHMDIER